MKPSKLLLFSLPLLLALPAAPQNAAPNTAASAPTAVPPLIPYSGVVGSVSGLQSATDANITFLIYKDEQGGEPLFAETQTVALDSAGHYKAQLGATLANGIPLELFATGEARWLEVQIAGEMPQPRVLLASVPYALKAADAATLDGMPASAFALAGTRSAANAVPSITPNLATDVTTTGGIAGYVPKFSGASSVIDSPVFISGADVGIGTTTPTSTLDVNGTAFVSGALVSGDMTANGTLELAATGTATASTGYGSQIIKMYTSAYNSTSKAVVNPRFEWEALATGNNTAAPSATLNLLSSTTSAGATETGFYFNANGTMNFAPGQTLPAVTGNETVTGTLSASQLTSTAATGTAPLKVTSTTQVLNLNASLLGGLSASAFATHAANTFAGNQFIGGTGAAGNYGLTVNQPSQTGILVESVLTGVGAGIDLQTTGSGGKDWEILATGNSAIQGPGKFNIRDINTSTDVFTISSTDAVTVGGTLTLQANVKDSNTSITSSNVIGGWSGNTVTNSATGATIAGGGESTEAGGPNTVSADFGTVGGGENNTASVEASTVAGGYANTASGFGSTVAGGGINTASGSTSTVPGGYSNLASGDISFAAGFVAHATDSGSFVWCQQNGSLCSSSGTNSFVVSVNGPIYFYDGPNGQGCYLSAGSGSWTCSSDRSLKDNFASISPRSVLDRVVQMPISQWSMKADSAGHKHIGPMAQDFYAAFGLGETDKYIAQGDAQGVALASIQGLYQMMQEKLQQKDEEIHALEVELQALEERMPRK